MEKSTLKTVKKSRSVELGIFSLGISYTLYFFMQYFFAPICFLLSQNIDSLVMMNAVFSLFEVKNLDVFTTRSIIYSLAGFAAFLLGFYLVPAKIWTINNEFISKKWGAKRAEKIFWIFLLGAFAFKTAKVLAGDPIADVVEGYIKHGFITNPYITFYLSFNWLHFVALVVINVAYFEAKAAGHDSVLIKRLKLLANGYTVFYFALSLLTGSRTATLFPLLSYLIIRQYYSPVRFSLVKFTYFISSLVLLIVVIKILLAEWTGTEGYDMDDGVIFALFYVLFNRVNLSHVVASVIERAQQAFPNGTLGQFWVEMSLYGSERKNILDGNELGRAIGVATETDTVTGVAVTNMGELFINFDVWGIIFGMLLTGVLYKILFANCQRRAPLAVMMYALMWPILIHGMESPITVLYATAIKMIGLCLFVHLIISYKFTLISSKNSKQAIQLNNSNENNHP